MKSQKMMWVKPKITSINKKYLDNKIYVSACSKYIPCGLSIFYTDSIPGGGKPELE